MKDILDWKVKFSERFGHYLHKDIDYTGSYYELEAFISDLLEQARKEAIEEVLEKLKMEEYDLGGVKNRNDVIAYEQDIAKTGYNKAIQELNKTINSIREH